MAPMKSEYLDVIISDVRTNNGFGFSVQILNTEGRFPMSGHLDIFSITKQSRDCITGKAHARVFDTP